MLTYLSVPLFKLICQDNGPNGLEGVYVNYLKIYFDQFYIYWLYLISVFTNQSLEDNLSSLQVTFTTKVNNKLPLVFDVSSITREVDLGKSELIFFTVKNYTNSDVMFTSIYSVYPSEAIYYIEKIQCFCYEDQILEKNSQVSLPVYYRINPLLANDPLFKNVKHIVISYSLFNI